jgi:hypothetical protein
VNPVNIAPVRKTRYLLLILRYRKEFHLRFQRQSPIEFVVNDIEEFQPHAV